jgi:hypothetical protein
MTFEIILSEEERDALSEKEYKDMMFVQRCVESGAMSRQPVLYVKRRG